VKLTLLEKIPRGRDQRFISELEKRLEEIASGLLVEFEILDLTDRRMPMVQVSGEDEEAVVEILRKSFGLAPKNIRDLRNQSVQKGFIEKASEQKDLVTMDVGLEDSASFRGILRAERLSAQLFDGALVPLHRMMSRFGFVEDFPLEIRVVSCDEAGQEAEVELSDRQRDVLEEWTRLPFDRITVQNSTASEVSNAVRKAALERDVAGVESLSLSTHSLICKLGTDGQGLVRRLGSQLEAANLFVFHPDRERAVEARRKTKGPKEAS